MNFEFSGRKNRFMHIVYHFGQLVASFHGIIINNFKKYFNFKINYGHYLPYLNNVPTFSLLIHWISHFLRKKKSWKVLKIKHCWMTLQIVEHFHFCKFSLHFYLIVVNIVPYKHTKNVELFIHSHLISNRDFLISSSKMHTGLLAFAKCEKNI